MMITHTVKHTQSPTGLILATCEGCQWAVQVDAGKPKILDPGDPGVYHSLTLFGYVGDPDGENDDDTPLPGSFKDFVVPT